MTKAEFLLQQTHDVIEIFEECGSYTTTFAILYDDGTTDSFATQFDSLITKKNFDYLMRKLCTNPKVVACVFTSEGWSSEMAEKENKRPSECPDRKANVIVLYSARDEEQEMRLYIPDINRKLELVLVSKTHSGRFSNPFHVPCLTKAEREKAVAEFQEVIRGSLCRGFEKFHYMGYVLFFLTDTPEQCSVRQLTEEEWLNKKWFNQMIRSKCHEHETIAFILAYPENDKVKIILVSAGSQEIFSYSIDPGTNSMKLETREPYKGEFSGLIKVVEVKFGIPELDKRFMN